MTDKATTAEARYRNALLWIRALAGMHYLGGAFEPDHMRDLGNFAADALQGRDLPDYEARMAGAQDKAREQAALLSRQLQRPEIS